MQIEVENLRELLKILLQKTGGADLIEPMVLNAMLDQTIADIIRELRPLYPTIRCDFD